MQTLITKHSDVLQKHAHTQKRTFGINEVHTQVMSNYLQISVHEITHVGIGWAAGRASDL